MELQEVKRLVEHFEDRISHNFEIHFSQLVLEDFYEGGYTDRIEDEFFYEEYFEKYEQNIINLLIEIEDSFDSEFLDFKLRLIKLKRIIDTRLSKIENNNYTLKRTKRRNVQFLFNSKINTKKFIKEFHNQLLKHKFINIDFEDFKIHFSNNWDSKIQWFGTELQLVHLITLLIEKKFLDSETQNFKNLLIASHFLNKNRNAFKEKQLGSVLADKRDMIANDDVTFLIIKEISTHF